MALEGTLRDFSFADILQLISLQRKTGVLTLKSDDNVTTVSFVDGTIVGASTLNQHTEDLIGLILLKRGEVEKQELQEALDRQQETLQRLGRILIDHGVVTVDTVRSALQQQILQIVYRIFRWNDGDYHFSQESDIDFDRELTEPMAADHIIMEGARMTDEWPFIEQRLPDRNAVLVKVDPGRALRVVEPSDDDFDDFGFSFTETPQEGPPPVRSEPAEGQVTPDQLAVYQLVNGLDDVHELILASPLIEFETCKSLAELLELGLVRVRSREEIVEAELLSEPVAKTAPRWLLNRLPWLAAPFLVLLGFALTVMPRNPMNPTFRGCLEFWEDIVVESQSWLRMEWLARAAETEFVLHGLYPGGLDELSRSGMDPVHLNDPWGRPYRIAIRGDKLMFTGSDSRGQPVPMLILSRNLAWEGETPDSVDRTGPGLILLP
ncbi:MAG: DUF4388 domain-containing protein [Thermoanaerobaculales bacterium]|jgi:hypothetical protein|nr:DUF4388 domain-containing protein [Thermoanaerobaculales bacterium]